MKKLLLSLALATACVVGASAQDYLLDNPSNRAYFGLRASGEITCPGNVKTAGIGVDMFKVGGGSEIGAIYNIPVVANFYIEPGLKLYYNTYSLKDIYLDEIDDDITGYSVRKFGMRIPVNFGYHFDFTPDTKVYVFTGPELEVGFVGKEHFKAFGMSDSLDIYGDDGGMNRVDCLWGFGAGVSYQHVYFGVSGAVGLCNMIKDGGDMFKFKENRVSFTLGYNF